MHYGLLCDSYWQYFLLIVWCILYTFKTIYVCNLCMYVCMYVCVCSRNHNNKNMCLCWPDLWLGSCSHDTFWPRQSWSSPHNKLCSHGKWSELPPEVYGKCGTRNTQSARAGPGSWSLQKWWAKKGRATKNMTARILSVLLELKTNRTYTAMQSVFNTCLQQKHFLANFLSWQGAQ